MINSEKRFSFKSALFLLYALGGYLVGFAALIYLMGFFIDYLVPKGISSSEIIPNLWFSIFYDLSLIFIFGAFHSFTARSSFKKKWTKIIPPPIERATYIYMSSISVAALVYFWQPISISVWKIEGLLGLSLMYSLYGMIWVSMVCATFQFGHFKFFGIAQAWYDLVGHKEQDETITTRFLYALIRHPISVGWILMPLVAPDLTVGHLIFSFGTIIYVLLATPFEEKDLIDELGDDYIEYRKTTPALVPMTKRKSASKNN